MGNQQNAEEENKNGSEKEEKKKDEWSGSLDDVFSSGRWKKGIFSKDITKKERLEMAALLYLLFHSH